ncbi:MAG: hypothetical protein M3179_13190 [Actinomycetota bacterium]|nr:hypothetical protein [Actinomycetota bacterium]
MAAAVTVALALTISGCGSRDQFGPRSIDEVAGALTAEGLQICDSRPTDGHANQALAGREFVVAIDCQSDDEATVVVDEFADAEARDAAARNFEGQVRPRAYGAVWTFGSFAVYASGPRDDEVEERVTDALDQVGAE